MVVVLQGGPGLVRSYLFSVPLPPVSGPDGVGWVVAVWWTWLLGPVVSGLLS